MEPIAKIAGLIAIYPVKGCKPVYAEHAELEGCGLKNDRRWMLVSDTDTQPVFISQRGKGRERLALLQPTLTKTFLGLSGPLMEPVRIPLDREGRHVRSAALWGEGVAGADEGDEIAEWLSRYLGEPVRLVERITGARSYADTGHISLINASSVREMEKDFGDAIALSRFRANLLVESDSFAEDAWSLLATSSGISLRVSGPASRCMVIDIDQETAIRDPEQRILESVAKRRTVQSAGRKRVMLGIYLTVLSAGSGGRIGKDELLYSRES